MSNEYTLTDVSAYAHQDREQGEYDHYIIKDEEDNVLDVFPITGDRLVTWRFACRSFLFMFNGQKKVVRLYGRLYVKSATNDEHDRTCLDVRY